MIKIDVYVNIAIKKSPSIFKSFPSHVHTSTILKYSSQIAKITKTDFEEGSFPSYNLKTTQCPMRFIFNVIREIRLLSAARAIILPNPFNVCVCMSVCLCVCLVM